MLKCFKYELVKLINRKALIMLFGVCLVAFTALLVFKVENTSDGFYANQYKSIYEKIDGSNCLDALDYLDTRVQEIDAILLVEEYEWELANYGPSEITVQLNEKIVQAQNKYGNIIDENHDFDALREELSSIEVIRNEILLNSQYGSYIDNIQITADNLNGISIFQDQTDFSSANINKTAEDMKDMQDVSIAIGAQKGVLLFTEFPAIDVFSFILTLVFVYFIFFDEKENGLFSLTKTTPLGITQTYFAKVAALLTSVFVLWCLLYLVTLFFATTYFGLGNIHRSIQSIASFYTSDIKLSVLEMLFVLFTIRVIGCFLVGLVLMLITTKAKHSVFFVFLSLLVAGISFMLTSISPQSSLNLFKYVNLYSLFNPEVAISEYINLNLFGVPVNLKIILVLFGALLLIASIALGLWGYRKDSNEIRTLKLPCVFKKAPSIRYKSLIALELCKLRVLCKVPTLILVYVVVQCLLVNSSQFYIGPEEYYYSNYMAILEGELTDEKVEFLQNEKEQLELLEAKNNRLNEDYSNGKIGYSEFLTESSKNNLSAYRQNAFQKVYAQYEYLIENPTGHFLYDSGYKILLGIDEQHIDFWFVNALMACIMIIICLGNVFAQEHNSGVIVLLRTVKKGGKTTITVKMIVAFITSTIIFLLTYLPTIYNVLNSFGCRGIFSPLSSITELSHMKGCSVFEGLLIAFGIRYIVFLSISLIVLGISHRTQRSIVSMAVSIFTLIIPLLTHKIGIEILDYVSLYRPLVMNDIVREQDGLHVVLLCGGYVLVAILIGYTLYKNSQLYCKTRILRKWRNERGKSNGKQMDTLSNM